MQQKPGKLFLISASSGAGKTTLVREVIARLTLDHPIERVITYTTKAPRPGECDGIDYHFLSEAAFLEKLEQGFFVEYSTVYGAYYGFPRTILDNVNCGTSYVGIVDRAGAASIKAAYADVILVWIKAPDVQTLETRLASRAQDSADMIAFRLAIAQQELAQEATDELYDHTIVNDDLEQSITGLENIIRCAWEEFLAEEPAEDLAPRKL